MKINEDILKKAEEIGAVKDYMYKCIYARICPECGCIIQAELSASHTFYYCIKDKCGWSHNQYPNVK
jgi:hypothetical protein